MESEDGKPLEDESGAQRLLESLAPSNRASSVHTSDFLDDWSKVVISYCSRKLTFETNKLIALQGIADKIVIRQLVRQRASGMRV